MLPDLAEANLPMADKGGDGCAARFRKALTDLETEPCIPGRAKHKQPIRCDADLCEQSNRVERVFGRLKDRRRIATRYDLRAHTFMSAIRIPETITFRLRLPRLGCVTRSQQSLETTGCSIR